MLKGSSIEKKYINIIDKNLKSVNIPIDVIEVFDINNENPIYVYHHDQIGSVRAVIEVTKESAKVKWEGIMTLTMREILAEARKPEASAWPYGKLLVKEKYTEWTPLILKHF